jgi:hypothetical protein
LSKSQPRNPKGPTVTVTSTRYSSHRGSPIPVETITETRASAVGPPVKNLSKSVCGPDGAHVTSLNTLPEVLKVQAGCYRATVLSAPGAISC